ncbi:MAG: hypothetical protein GY696_24070 [Gammaproteobacteria bacterium]|nr:hypothetical protein [Gammaproteobacteria bacterium]
MILFSASDSHSDVVYFVVIGIAGALLLVATVVLFFLSFKFFLAPPQAPGRLKQRRKKEKTRRELKKALKKNAENSTAIERLENAAKRYLEVHDEETAPAEEAKKLVLEAKKALEKAKMYWEKNKKSASEKVLEQPNVPEPPTSAKAAQPASAKEPTSDYLESPGDRAGKDAQPVSVDGVGEEEI